VAAVEPVGLIFLEVVEQPDSFLIRPKIQNGQALELFQGIAIRGVTLWFLSPKNDERYPHRRD
jgi:hypothetical protein